MFAAVLKTSAFALVARLWILAALAVVGQYSLASEVAVLIQQPVAVTADFNEKEPIQTQGRLNLNLLIVDDDARGKARFIAEVRTFALVLKAVASTPRLAKLVEGLQTRSDIGISVVPNTRIELEYDTDTKMLHGNVDVAVELPRGERFASKTHSTSEEMQTGRIDFKLHLPEGLQSLATSTQATLPVSVEMTLAVSAFSNPRMQLRPFRARIRGLGGSAPTPASAPAPANSQSTTTLRAVSMDNFVVYNELCLQPIAVRVDSNDTAPAGYQEDSQGTTIRDSMKAELPDIEKIWGSTVGTLPVLTFEVRPWIFMELPNVKIVTREEEDLLSRDFPDIEPDCIEIYFISEIQIEEMHGALTNGQGTSAAQIIFTDEVIQRNVKGRLAHELGHVLSIPHTDMKRPVDQYSGTPGTVVCVYRDWDTQHPIRNSSDNIAHLWIPAGLSFQRKVLPRSEVAFTACTGVDDCGDCGPPPPN